MPQPLVLAVAQPLCVALDVVRNAETHAATIRAAAARVVVFPELSLTGYELGAPGITPNDPRISPIIEACAETGALALVGAPVQIGGGPVHIAMLAVESTGASVAYRKLWLAEEESRRFTPGKEPTVLDVDGWRLGLAICKDTGVAQHASHTSALGVDAYVAGTLMAPNETAIQNDRARRIATSHQVWVAMASFAGPTGGGYADSAGCSGIWEPDGTVRAQAGPETGAVVRATLR